MDFQITLKEFFGRNIFDLRVQNGFWQQLENFGVKVDFAAESPLVDADPSVSESLFKDGRTLARHTEQGCNGLGEGMFGVQKHGQRRAEFFERRPVLIYVLVVTVEYRRIGKPPDRKVRLLRGKSAHPRYDQVGKVGVSDHLAFLGARMFREQTLFPDAAPDLGRFLERKPGFAGEHCPDFSCDAHSTALSWNISQQ